ncbi:MAG: alanine--tRNA ligase-related protein [Armatimonadota bacterium]
MPSTDPVPAPSLQDTPADARTASDPSTVLEYLDEPFRYSGKAFLKAITLDPRGRQSLVLDQTIFYPQGGGQPSDIGIITGPDFRFSVEAVTFTDGIVYHAGSLLEGEPPPQTDVTLEVNPQVRQAHSRLHSGGHLLLNAVKDTGLALVATKGYHFADGPYVAFDGSVAEDEKEAVQARLQSVVDRLIAEDVTVSWAFVPADRLAAVCENVPANVPHDKPTRVITIGNVSQPCGGTHVRSLHDLAGMQLARIRSKKGEVRISYSLPSV